MTNSTAHPWGSSRKAVFSIQISYLLVLGAFVVLYRLDKIDPRDDFLGPVPFLVPWFGAVGAALLSLTGVFEHRGRDWNPEYCYWHWARPVVGAVVGTLSVLAFQAGILAVGGQTPDESTTGTPKNLLYYLVAFVVGYREDVFRQLMKRVADVILMPARTEPQPPAIESVEPSAAKGGQSTPVTIVGRGLAGVTSARLGQTALEFTSASDARVTVTIPNSVTSPGTTTLAVTTTAGTATTPFTITT